MKQFKQPLQVKNGQKVHVKGTLGRLEIKITVFKCPKTVTTGASRQMIKSQLKKKQNLPQEIKQSRIIISR